MDQQGLLQQPGTPPPTPQAPADPQAPAAPTAPTEVGEPATPEEQEAYDRAVKAMSEVLHVNDETSQQFMELMQAEPGMGGVTKGAVMLITEIDKQINIPEAVLMGLLPEAYDMLIDLAVEAGVMPEPGEDEAGQALGAGTQLLLEVYGAEAQDMAEFANASVDKHGDELLHTYKRVAGAGGEANGQS